MLTLTEHLRQTYFNKASKKINDDFVELRNFTKSKGLDVSYERLSGENEAQHIYEIARKMWEADGYEEQPTSFTRNSERENRFLTDILSENIVKECNDMHDANFIKMVDSIVKEKK